MTNSKISKIISVVLITIIAAAAGYLVGSNARRIDRQAEEIETLQEEFETLRESVE